MHGQSALHRAAMRGKPEPVRQALAALAAEDACAVDDYENSALHLVAAYGHGRGDRSDDFAAAEDSVPPPTIPGAASAAELAETMELLLASSAAGVLEAENSYEKTALAEACVHGNVAVAQALMRGGAHTGALDTDGWPLLHSAAKNGHPEVCQLLIEDGAAVDALYCGLSALHSAACSVWRVRAIAVARLLIAAGIAAGARNEDGHTAAELAAAKGWSATARECFTA